MGKTSMNHLLNSQTYSGIEVLGNMSWGTHFCQFYNTTQDLLEILVPYFKTGLESNEFCLWIISDPINIKDATEALKKAVPELDRYLIEQKIEILSHKDWYLRGGSFNLERVINGWNEKLKQALERGCTGMRVSGNGGWIENKEWENFLEYEGELNRLIAEKRMVVLCTYPLKKSQASDVLDVAFAHDSALSKRNGRWEIVEVPENKKTKAQMQMVNEELEERVAERTKELIATNAELRREIAERKHAEDALRRSEDRIRLIIDTIPTETWTVRPDGIVDFYNQRWLDYAGEGAIEDPYGIVHPEDLPGVREKWLAKMAAEEPSEAEMRLRRADGEYRWFLVRTAPLRDEHGNLVKWFGVSIDIEDSKRAKDELRLAYQRLSYHVENTPLAVIEFDKNLFIKRWSKRAEEIFGWKESEALGKNVNDPDFLIIYEEDIPAVNKINEQLTEGIVNWNLSLNRNYTKDGKVIYSEWYNSVLKDEHGNVITILSLVHNVTERKKAEEQKKFEQRDKEALINSADDMIWSVGKDFKLIAINKAFVRGLAAITGVTAKPGDNVLMPDFFPADIVAFWKEAYSRALTGETFKIEIHVPVSNTVAESWSETSFNPIYKDETVVALACYSRNITARKKAEEELHQLNEELRSLSSHLQNIREEERMQIARDIHDELGQKLTGLKMDVTWLNKKLGTGDEIVKQKIHSIIELIDETLKSIRKISSDLRPSLLDNIGLIAALEWHSEEMAKRSEIRVNFSADISEPNIPVAKVTSIFRIYKELLTNALRHANARAINSSLRLHDNHLVLEIKDDGQGMDPEITATKKTLGLIGIKERTFALGGKYDLKSELGKGTEVKISIPL